MATTNLKENLQCFAFAYFAENGKVTKDHEEEWYAIFNDSSEQRGTDLRSLYGKYLSPAFSPSTFDDVLKKYKSKTTKTGKISVNTAVKKVYLVVKKIVNSSFFTTSMSRYEFLDQLDPFTTLVKDTCLTKIAKAFKMAGKADLFSPIDIFIVKRDKKDSILQDFKTNIINATDDEIMSNMAWGATGKNTYRTISNKYFKSKDLVGVSLKLPETIKGAGVLKIVGTEDVDPHLLNFIDPYTKLLSAMLAHPQKTKELIDKVVDIEFDNFRITPSILSWEYPVTFKYKDIVDPRTGNELHKHNLRFKLFTWSNAGFNAQWYKGQGAPGNWTGGAGIESLGELFIKYNEYPKILDELIAVRKESFYFAIHGSTNDPTSKIPKDLKDEYKKALNSISTRGILTSSKKGDSKDLIDFFTKYDPTNKKYYIYQKQVIKNTTKNIRSSSSSVTSDKKRLDAHYIACQCAWFLFRGGESLHKYLKQRMFLSLFGLITKSGYKIFQGDEETVMENYIQKTFAKNKRSVTAYFNSAPHLVLS